MNTNELKNYINSEEGNLMTLDKIIFLVNKSIKNSVSTELKQHFQNWNKNLYKDYVHRKNLHDSITKLQHNFKINKMKSDLKTEEILFNKFEQRMKSHFTTISKNDNLIIKLKEKESEYIEKLKQTLEKQNSISMF